MEPLDADRQSDSVERGQRSSVAFDGKRALVLMLGAAAGLAGILAVYWGSTRDRSAAPSAPAAASTTDAPEDQSCEAALDAYRAQPHVEGGQPDDVTAGQYGRVLNQGAYFSHCNVPSSMGVTICAAVQLGRAVGVTVTTQPSDAAKAACVDHAVRGLSFPSHPLLDIVRTRFEAK